MTSSAVRKSSRSITSRAARSVATLAAAATLSVLGMGCASTQSAPVREPARAQGPVSNLHASIRVITDATPSTIGQQYAEALRWAGVEVVPAVADADVETELRLKVRKDASNQPFADVTLSVRAGQEQLASAMVSYPLNQEVSKDDLSLLTSTLTQSPSVRAHAERVEVEKQRRAQAAESAAWQLANATVCAQSPKFSDCTQVIRYLNGFPAGQHRAEAEQALMQAQGVRQRASRDAGIARVKADVSAWKTAHVEVCRSPESAASCDGVNAYVAAYPAGRYAVEAKDLLAQSQTKLSEQQEKAAIKSAMARRPKTAQR